MASENTPLTATAGAIEGAFGVPARTIRRWAKAGTVTRLTRGQYNVRQVLELDEQRRGSESR